jgi:UDP-N-acetylglucosamine 2-epimerase (non-hydrolysing)
MILVHGDTTTTFSAALSAFYNGVKVGHVEAGLRSGDKYSPYPEEMNRSLTGRIADIHFAPTDGNITNLTDEGISPSTILKTGNTVIDALKGVIREDYVFEDDHINSVDFDNKKVVLLTSHRRENIGQAMENIFAAIKEIALTNEDAVIIFPMHLNPKVREIAYKHMSDVSNIHLVEPLEYEPFANLINKSYLVLTDSGGIQEEAPALGKPVLVLRTETERPEAVDAGTVKMVGVDKNVIIKETNVLLRDIEKYKSMSEAVNPYGDGLSSMRIVEGIKDYFK